MKGNIQNAVQGFLFLLDMNSQKKLELLFRKYFLQIFYFFQIVPISLMFYDDKKSEVTKAEQKLRRKLDIPHVI